ncbi:ABC transporter permease [Brevibacterium permense]|uniref:ABC transporter permease n=1 Tax=Brevibacterium permense TaxID=234834 RepID=UPI0021CEF804|nr:ABC transporter permease [Brevibacterium permense]MCU4299109.1 ABC transporter permease [Brevibacterium permense]
MRIPTPVKAVLSVIVCAVLAFVYIPLIIVVISSFNASQSLGWPPQSFTFEWWVRAFSDKGALSALGTSLIVAACATLIALVLGTLASLALDRFEFFGKEAVNLLIVLPIALPGIITGIALNNAFTTMLGWRLGLLTVITAHATFCIVTIYNNVFARMRRMSGNLRDAAMDLGADSFTTFRLVTFPQLRSALLAGGLLAFGLSFDEIIVTQFTAGTGVQTLPIWIFDNMFRPNQAPIVNVIATFLVIVSIIPITLANRIGGKAATGVA